MACLSQPKNAQTRKTAYRTAVQFTSIPTPIYTENWRDSLNLALQDAEYYGRMAGAI